MKITALPVHTFEDVTLNMEQLQTLLTAPGANLPFVQLLKTQKIVLAGPYSLNFGSLASGVGANAAIATGFSWTNHTIVGTPILASLLGTAELNWSYQYGGSGNFTVFVTNNTGVVQNPTLMTAFVLGN